MKPALLEVMRMNRICRMVLATCLGSFILVIFYFQSMLHPGGRESAEIVGIHDQARLRFHLLVEVEVVEVVEALFLNLELII
ncbi:hypothetical protein STEG23_010831 [Scotinomys teguina]